MWEKEKVLNVGTAASAVRRSHHAAAFLESTTKICDAYINDV
jgi:hypothetical protein